MRIAVLGAGVIGTTIARRWQTAGHDIIYGARDPGGERYQPLAEEAAVETIPEAVEGADAVLIAIPGGSIPGLLDEQGAILDGRVLIDASNDVSGAHFHQIGLFEERVPNAHVFRAFCSLGWENFADPIVGGERADLFYSGPEGEAQGTVERLIADVGLRPVYVGAGAAGATVVDGVTRLWFTLALQRGHGRHLAFRTLGLLTAGPE